jgi:hypothetical protein
MDYRYGATRYRLMIRVVPGNGSVVSGSCRFRLDDAAIDTSVLTLVNDGKEHRVDIVLSR